MASYPGNRWVCERHEMFVRRLHLSGVHQKYVYLLDDLPKRRCPLLFKPCDPDSLAYLDFSVSTTGMLAGVKVWLFIPITNVVLRPIHTTLTDCNRQFAGFCCISLLYPCRSLLVSAGAYFLWLNMLNRI